MAAAIASARGDRRRVFVPQSRERVFIVAVDNALRSPPASPPCAPPRPFHPPALIAASRRQTSAPIWLRLPIPPRATRPSSILSRTSLRRPSRKPASGTAVARPTGLVGMMAQSPRPRSRRPSAPASGSVGGFLQAHAPRQGRRDVSGERASGSRSASTASPDACERGALAALASRPDDR